MWRRNTEIHTLTQSARDKNADALVSEKMKKVGRPCRLSPELLRHRRDRLHGIFEARWFKVGWDLKQACTPERIARALAPLAEYKEPIIGLLLINVKPGTTREQIRALRRERAKLLKQFEDLQDKKAQCSKLLIEAQDANAQASGRLASALDWFKEARKKRRRKKTADKQEKIRYRAERSKWQVIVKNANLEVERTVTALNDCLGGLRRLQKQLEELDALFVQSELLRFLDNTRYPITPLNVATAIAGFPEMGWRRSFLLCRKEPLDPDRKAPIASGLLDQVKQFMAKNRPQSASGAVECFQKLLFGRRRSTSAVREFLKHNWTPFEASIREAWKTRENLEARPFRIVAQLMESIRTPQGHVNSLLQE